MNRMNERDVHRHTDREGLLRKIQAIGFAKTEAGLYLDAHPDCSSALEYYHRLANEYKMLCEQYENEFGALTAEGTAHHRWNWIDGSWPWQLETKEG